MDRPCSLLFQLILVLQLDGLLLQLIQNLVEYFLLLDGLHLSIRPNSFEPESLDFFKCPQSFLVQLFDTIFRVEGPPSARVGSI